MTIGAPEDANWERRLVPLLIFVKDECHDV